MEHLDDILKSLSAMPGSSLVICMVLAGFGLAAYAIYAVLSMAKERR